MISQGLPTLARRTDGSIEPEARHALSVSGLSCTLGGQTIVRDVSFAAPAGALTALLGANGAGKTTTLRGVLGMVPARGTVLVGGERLTRATRHRIGYVAQAKDIAWDYPLTVEDAVVSALIAARPFWRGLRTEDARAIADAMRRCGVADLRERSVGELSGGQKQRVLLARALVRAPDVLLLDEPFTGLDHPAATDLTTLLAELTGSGVCVVMVHHDIAHTVRIADHIVLLARTVVAAGTPAQLAGSDAWQRALGVPANSPVVACHADTGKDQPC